MPKTGTRFVAMSTSVAMDERQNPTTPAHGISNGLQARIASGVTPEQ